MEMERETLRLDPEKKGGRMNKTEEKWAWYLTSEKQAGRIAWFGFEDATFRLTSKVAGVTRVSYTPDFLIVMPDGTIRIDEIKGGYIREDADLKFKMAAEKYPFFDWRMVQLKKDGDFHLIRFIPRRRLAGRGPVEKFPKDDG
jgi:hypothetical protein